MIVAIVLAAGKSTRMGRPKPLLSIGHRGETFLSRIVATFRAAGVDDVVVVLGHEADTIRAAFTQGYPELAGAVRFVVNASYEEGQLSSLLAGIAAIDRPGIEAALVTLVDVPLVTVTTVSAVIARYRATRARLVRPVRGDRHGHPVLFDRTLFDELRASDAATGAKPVVRRNASSDGEIDTDDEGAFADIDTPAEYARMTAVSHDRN
jgi:molybdenum cofactor cytidylyltransferase